MAKYLAASSHQVTIMAAKLLFAVSLSLMLLPGRAGAQGLSGADSGAIADSVGRLFRGIADATNALDLHRVLALHEQSDALTYTARGRVTRGFDAFRSLVTAQLGGLQAADVRLTDPVVDVLDRDVAVAMSLYTFTATFPSGSQVTTTGTYTCVFVRRNGGWKIRHSSHTFPDPSS